MANAPSVWVELHRAQMRGRGLGLVGATLGRQYAREVISLVWRVLDAFDRELGRVSLHRLHSRLGVLGGVLRLETCEGAVRGVKVEQLDGRAAAVGELDRPARLLVRVGHLDELLLDGRDLRIAEPLGAEALDSGRVLTRDQLAGWKARVARARLSHSAADLVADEAAGLGHNEVWGVNAAGNVYLYAGGGKWTLKGSGFRHVSAGTIDAGTQHVYAVKTNGSVVRWLPT